LLGDRLLRGQPAIEISPQRQLLGIEQGIQNGRGYTARAQIDNIGSLQFQSRTIAPPGLNHLFGFATGACQSHDCLLVQGTR
jgi:hypothetical protein